jgi:hypothetical protein
LQAAAYPAAPSGGPGNRSSFDPSAEAAQRWVVHVLNSAYAQRAALSLKGVDCVLVAYFRWWVRQQRDRGVGAAEAFPIRGLDRRSFEWRLRWWLQHEQAAQVSDRLTTLQH